MQKKAKKNEPAKCKDCVKAAAAAPASAPKPAPAPAPTVAPEAAPEQPAAAAAAGSGAGTLTCSVCKAEKSKADGFSKAQLKKKAVRPHPRTQTQDVPAWAFLCERGLT